MPSSLSERYRATDWIYLHAISLIKGFLGLGKTVYDAVSHHRRAVESHHHKAHQHATKHHHPEHEEEHAHHHEEEEEKEKEEEAEEHVARAVESHHHKAHQHATKHHHPEHEEEHAHHHEEEEEKEKEEEAEEHVAQRDFDDMEYLDAREPYVSLPFAIPENSADRGIQKALGPCRRKRTAYGRCSYQWWWIPTRIPRL